MKSGETGGGTNKWVYFKKMDMLMSAAPRQAGLSCGLDSGEYVFMNPRVYLNRPNGLDEMRDSPGNSGSSGGEEDDSDGLPPKRKSCGQDNNEGSSFRLLANSIQKFSEIYEKIENSKRQQMVELEKMRMDFHRDLELQKRQIVERAQAEIAKIRQGDDEETEVSTENAKENILEVPEKNTAREYLLYIESKAAARLPEKTNPIQPVLSDTTHPHSIDTLDLWISADILKKHGLPF
ncbi:Trihelix transcription factor ASIL2 [Vitis vinifera]|uniref:Trihelix transcription factor ASIL2 n=1 Tax=Vitis vinifera TaxID=29760 RepID=A0A438HU68_VITVI|nr:Trihelix transcription factor ASIL2 [Vitis vinifera]